MSNDDCSLETNGAFRNFSQVISERARDMLDQIAVFQSDGNLTFTQLEDLANRCAGLLHRVGLTQNANCAFSFEDELTLMIVWLATARLQVTPEILIPSSTPSQWQEAIQLCRSISPGEIRLRAPGMFSGYLGDREVTDEALRDGWFHPGDSARLTSDGHLFLLGRTDQMMIWGGVNIYPAEIERVMAEHPAVLDVAVMALRHSVAQDVPVCCIVLDKRQSIQEATLMEFARRELGGHAPARNCLVDRIPRNDLGKVGRVALKSLTQGAEQQAKPVATSGHVEAARPHIRTAQTKDLDEILEMVEQLSAFEGSKPRLTIDQL